MGNVRSLTRSLVAVAVLGHAGGCITITPAAKPTPADAAKPPAGGVVPAGGVATPQAAAPAPKPSAAPTVTLSMPKFSLKTEKPGIVPLSMAMAWNKRVEHLPDPTKDGAMGPGLVGQLFLYGNGTNSSGTVIPVPADGDGKLTVVLSDESGPASVRLGQWVFEKDALKSLVSVDERWGKCHTIFLPWPTYSIDVTKIKLTGKFEPEVGHPFYAAASVIVIDSSVPGSNYSASSSSMPIHLAPPQGGGPGGPPANGLPQGSR